MVTVNPEIRLPRALRLYIVAFGAFWCLNDDTILTADVFLYSIGPGTRRRREQQLGQLRAWLDSPGC